MKEKLEIQEQTTQSGHSELNTERTLKSIHRTLFIIALMLAANVLYFGRDLIMPILFGLLLAVTLSPIVRFLKRLGIPTAVSASLLVVIAGLVVFAGAYSLSDSFGDMVDSAPQVRERIQTKLLAYQQPIDSIKQASEQLENLVESVKSDDDSTVAVDQPSFITTAASTLATSATSFSIALFLALFLLSTGTLFHEKLIDLMPALKEKKRALKIVHDIENQVSRYLLTITLINAGLGCAIAFCMMLLDVPNPLVWGAVAMFLNYLPFVGAIVGALAVGLVSLTTFDTTGAALLPMIAYYGCSLLEGSIVTPLIIGHRLSLNIVAVFLSVTIWGWLWGIPGMLMAVPLLVAVRVICDHIHDWAAFGHFLTGRIQWNSTAGASRT